MNRLPPLGNSRQVSQYLAVSEMDLTNVVDAVDIGFPKAVRVAGERRWRFDDIDAWLEAHADEACAE